MTTIKVTKKQLTGFVKEEKQTSQLYNRLGFHHQALQESQHAKFFNQLKKKLS